MTRKANLKPEIAQQIHILAVKWFDKRSAAIEQLLTIDGLTAITIRLEPRTSLGSHHSYQPNLKNASP